MPFNATSTAPTATDFENAVFNYSGCGTTNWCEVSAEVRRENGNNDPITTSITTTDTEVITTTMYSPIVSVVVSISYHDLIRTLPRRRRFTSAHS